MDTLADLESFATNAASEGDRPKRPSSETVSQYMDIFGLNERDAAAKIHELQGLLPEKAPVPQRQSAAAYLVKLQEHLPTAEVVQAIAQSAEIPEVVTGTDDSGRETYFCRVDHDGRIAIAAHFADGALGRAPTFLQLTQAAKSLSNVSAAPMLGVDTTMPQHRADKAGVEFRPRQEEYPVWYFVYGPLADPNELAVILGRSEGPDYRAAAVYGARLLSSNAMVDAEISDVVLGEALYVTSQKDEESLRFSVTDKFEVVRCKMMLIETAEVVDGLAFRYVGKDI